MAGKHDATPDDFEGPVSLPASLSINTLRRLTLYRE